MNRVGGFGWRLSVLLGAIRVAFGPRPGPIAMLRARRPFWLRLWHSFKSPPPPPPPRPFIAPLWFGEPDSELGVAVPVRQVLVSAPEAAVALVDCVAYTTGFRFSFVIRTKRDINPTAMGFPGPYMQPPPEPQFQFGVRFADGGESKSSLGVHPRMSYYQAIQEGREPEIPVGPVISPMGSGGGGRRWNFNYWVWPLPPDGPVTITLEWPKLWDGAVTGEVDGTAIHKAGEGSERLW